MKTTVTQTTLLSLVTATLMACSGGGGSGGAGLSGDTPAPSSEITTPPSQAKGTATEFSQLTDGKESAVYAGLLSAIDISAFTISAGPALMGAESCYTVTGTSTDADLDGFSKLTISGKGCKEENTSYPGYSNYVNFDAQSNDEDDSNPLSNATFTSKYDVSTKKDSDGSVGAAGYAAAKAAISSAGMVVTLQFKEGGYNNLTSPVIEDSYQAYWLTITFSEVSSSIKGDIQGFVQFYKKGKGHITLKVTSTGYTLDSAKCLRGGTLSLHFADGTLGIAQAKDICLRQETLK